MFSHGGVADQVAVSIRPILHCLSLQSNAVESMVALIEPLIKDRTWWDVQACEAFMRHFNRFLQYQAKSEGFMRALDIVQIFHGNLLECFLDLYLLGGAEELEMAIISLEEAMQIPRLERHEQWLLLQQKLPLLEESQLQLIEISETLVQEMRKTQWLN